MKKLSLLLFFVFFVTAVLPENQEIPDAARLQIALKKLTVVGTVLYVGAHPDDENTAVLSYLSLGKGVRTGYLSLTRGDGGQNLLGSEQGELLGIIRTQELLAAREVDDGEQFFTRAVDFGFSKTPEESIRFWDKDQVVSDIVWIIRSFRPDVVINRFTKAGGGHGHHTASAILSEEAFQMAGDPSKFPEQLKYVQPWQPKRLVWNRYSFGGQGPTEEEKASLAKMEIGSYNPTLGKSYTEIAGQSRSMHKSQADGDSQNRGKYMNYFVTIAGDPAKEDVLEGIDISWKRIPGGEQVGVILEKAYLEFDPRDPTHTIPALLQAYSLMQKLPPGQELEEKKKELLKVVKACSGMWLEAIAVQPSSIPGTDVKIAISALNRSDIEIQLESVQIDPGNAIEVSGSLKNNVPLTKELNLNIPASMPYTQPYWLEKREAGSLYVVSDQRMIGLPESPSPFVAKFRLSISGQSLELEEPVLYRWIDPVDGERYRVFEVAPELAIQINQPVTIYMDNNPKTVDVMLTGAAAGIAGNLGLKLPEGWKADPETVPFRFSQKNETINAQFQVRPSPGALRGTFLAEADIGGKKISSDLVSINYHHIPPQTVLIPAQAILLPLDMKKPVGHIGYVVGSGDRITECLDQVGYHVTLLSSDDLMSGDLSGYDAIVLGVRAYNTRPELTLAQPRLLDYVKNGGTLVVQHNTLQDQEMINPGPFPIRISRDRVSVEDSPITILNPQSPLLNFPNKISSKDFEGWVQERGVNFPDQWDPKYETVIACNDPGESPKAGGILFAKYGNGTFIYTTYSWFRQLPGGVPGAYRLFVNLISVGKAHGK
jgi:LmbE family N-acetylglucosaminyl deacetylase